MGYLAANKTGFTLKDITETRDIYTASADLFSYYAMADQRFGKSFRLIYGVRVEDFTQKLDAEYNSFTKVRINTNKVDVLPSVNAVYSINTKQNLRFSYSKTLNRPEFRELAPFLFRDYTIKYSVFGDTSLKRASIDNYDFRYEFYPGKAQLISASLFYKNFKDPIELIADENQDATLTYKNTPSSTLKGIEFEVRSLLGTFINAPTSSIWNKLTFFGNVSILKSKVNIKTTDTSNFYYSKGRVLQGQSPYVINAGLTYQDDEKDITSTISVNRYGQRVFLANNGETSQTGQLLVSNLFENGRTVLDFQITKAFPKKSLELKLNVKDILAQQLFFFEDNNDNAKYDKDSDVLRSTLNYGRTINFSLTYKFK
jgi:outer membrane receptor protein involved in Fe transport